MLNVWKNRNRLPLHLESLEDRTTPAGNIAAAVFDGVLYVAGDFEANRFAVHGAGSQMASIVPLDSDTTINGQAGNQLFQGIRKGIHIKSGEGDDLIQLNGFQARDTIVIYSEGGADNVQLNNVFAGKGAIIVTGLGNDRASILGSSFGSLFSLSMQEGDDFMQAAGNRFSAVALFNGGAGTNTFAPGDNSYSKGFRLGGFAVGAPPTDTPITPPVTPPVDPDTTAPTTTLSVSATNPTNANPIPYTVIFSESVTGFSAGDIAVTNGTVTNFTAVNGSQYTFGVIPTAQGTVTVSVPSGSAADAAGNASGASNSISLVFDSAAPTVTINTQTTNDTTPMITGTVSDSTATVTVIVDGKTYVATVTGTTYSATVTDVLPEGTYNVQARAIDTAGNIGTATADNGLVIDTTALGLTLERDPTASPTNAATVTYTATFSADVTDFALADITVLGGTAGTFVMSTPRIYTFVVTPDAAIPPAANVAVTVRIPADSAHNSLGTGNSLTTSSFVSDRVAPGVAITTTAANPTNLASIPFTAIFTEDVTGLTEAEVLVTNGTIAAGSFTAVNPTTYTFNVIPNADGPVTISIEANSATDAAGNGNTAGGAAVTSDRTLPTGTIDAAANDAVSGTAADTAPGTITGVLVSIKSGANYWDGDGFDSATEVFLPAVGTTNWSYAIAAEGTFDVNARITDNAGNVTTISGSIVVTDTIAPTATVSTTAANPTNLALIPFTVTFSENMTGFTEADLVLTNGAVEAGSFAGSGKTYTFNIVPTADGPVTVDVPAGVAQDAGGNNNAAGTATTVSDRTAPTGTIDATAAGAITGTAADTVPGVIAGVQVSIKSGANYWDGTGFNSATEVFLNATGTTTWSYAISATGTFEVNARFTDNAGNVTTVNEPAFIVT